MLYLNIKRTASNETILTGNTFLLNLDANFVDLDEYEGEYIATTDHIRQYPLSFYFNCLHKVLGYKTLKLAFGEDSKVSIEGKDERSGQFVPFEGKYQYFMTSSNKGYIDMDLDSELALLYKSLGDNKEVEREEWRNAAYISFELKTSSEGEILLALPVTHIASWVHVYYLYNKEELEQYHPNYWLKKFDLNDLLWIQLSQTGAN